MFCVIVIVPFASDVCAPRWWGLITTAGYDYVVGSCCLCQDQVAHC